MIADDRFMRCTKIIAPLEGFARLVQQFDRIRITDSGKRLFHRLQFCNVPFEQFLLIATTVQYPLNNKNNHIFL